MEICEAIRQRKSVRAFIDKPVEKEVIERILKTARWAPSGANSQPWQVAVVTGEMKKKVSETLLSAFNEGQPEMRDYDYYPSKWREPYKKRRIACGMQLYSTLGIDRKDRGRRMEQWRDNYRGFDAPVMLLFFLDSSLAIGSYMDYGMFLQSIMLAAHAEGLGTCAQAALSGYAPQVKELLGYPEESVLLCGMAMGYPDENAVINSYRTPREEVESFTRFYE